MRKMAFAAFLALAAAATSLVIPMAQAADAPAYPHGRASCVRLCHTDQGTGCDLKKHPDHPGVCAEQQKECIKQCPKGKVQPGYGLSTWPANNG